MSLIIREPSNPLANALGVLSQQILADAASRKEREFRAQEIAKERTFMSGENAATRAARKGEFDAEIARLTQVATDTRNTEKERIAANERIQTLQSNNALQSNRALAGAQAADARANTLMAEGNLELLKMAAKRGDAALQLQAGELGLSYDPVKGTFTQMPGFAGLGNPQTDANAGIVSISPALQRRAEDVGVNLPPILTDPGKLAGPINDSPLGLFAAAGRAIGERGGPLAIFRAPGTGIRAAQLRTEADALQDTLREMQSNAYAEQLAARERAARGEKIRDIVSGLIK